MLTLAGSFLVSLFDAGEGSGPSFFSRLATIALFLAAVHATAGRPGGLVVRWTGLAAIAAGMARLLSLLPANLEVVGFLLDASFLCVATVALVVHLFRSQVVDTDTLIGSLCIYLLIGMVWSVGFLVVNEVADGQAFVATLENPVAHRDLLYFSYVTLTTLGFGDVIPATPAAKTLVVFEAVIGQFYLAVLVARLLGLHLAASRNRS